MKIIAQGKIPEPPKPWWVGRRESCSNCKAEIELEDGDKVEEIIEKRPNGKTFAEVDCPTCGCKIAHEKKTMRVAVTVKCPTNESSGGTAAPDARNH